MTQLHPEPSRAEPTVVLAHRHVLLREGIARILSEAGFRVEGQADTVQLLRNLVTEQAPDIILLDQELADASAEAIGALTRASPSANIVILARPQPVGAVEIGVHSGASGYLSVDISPQEFIRALRLLAKGDIVVSREIADHSKERLVVGPFQESKDDLTQRERQVVSLVGRGATNREIAETLTVTESTVKVHMRRILDKLDLRNRQQAAAYAAEQGLLDKNA